MRATKAYIASLGTTGVLLGASILMLAVVSAVVAFDRWPSGNISTRVQTLVIAERPAPLRVTVDSGAPSATGDAGAAAPGASGSADGVPAPAQVVAGELVTRDDNRAPGSDTPGSGGPVETPLPDAVADETGPIINAISNPDTTAGQVADGTQSFTDGLGGAVGGLNPELGGLVAGAGQAAAQLLRDLPLRDGVLPEDR